MHLSMMFHVLHCLKLEIVFYFIKIDVLSMSIFCSKNVDSVHASLVVWSAAVEGKGPVQESETQVVRQTRK